MIPTLYVVAHQRLEREIKQSLEQIAGDSSRVRTVEKKMPHGFCGGPIPPLFEVYDQQNNLTACVSLGALPDEKPFYHTYLKIDGRLNIRAYTPQTAQQLTELAQSVGDVSTKIEQYAEEWKTLSHKICEAADGTLLRQPLETVEYLKKFALIFAESGVEFVMNFYSIARKHPAKCAQWLAVSEAEIKDCVGKIRQELSAEYLKLEEKLDAF